MRKAIICKKCQKSKKIFFRFYFLNFDFSFAFQNQCTIFYTLINNDLAEGSVSRKNYLGFSNFFMV